MILVQNLILPDIDPTLVILIGLSQTAFLGGKATASRTEITQVVPPEGQIGMPVQILDQTLAPIKILFGLETYKLEETTSKLGHLIE
jgi:hypothetical protein